MKEDNTFVEGYYVHGGYLPEKINGTTYDIGAGSHGETLFSANFTDETGKSKTVWGAHRISTGEANVFEFGEYGTSDKEDDKSIDSITKAMSSPNGVVYVGIKCN